MRTHCKRSARAVWILSCLVVLIGGAGWAGESWSAEPGPSEIRVRIRNKTDHAVTLAVAWSTTGRPYAGRKKIHANDRLHRRATGIDGFWAVPPGKAVVVSLDAMRRIPGNTNLTVGAAFWFAPQVRSSTGFEAASFTLGVDGERVYPTAAHSAQCDVLVRGNMRRFGYRSRFVEAWLQRTPLRLIRVRGKWVDGIPELWWETQPRELLPSAHGAAQVHRIWYEHGVQRDWRKGHGHCAYMSRHGLIVNLDVEIVGRRKRYTFIRVDFLLNGRPLMDRDGSFTWRNPAGEYVAGTTLVVRGTSKLGIDRYRRLRLYVPYSALELPKGHRVKLSARAHIYGVEDPKGGAVSVGPEFWVRMP